ncbi:Cleavage induced protein [Phytophthora megakarya]|uniref:Cleavage induced protein n=1 Tax=Phytophthora megakarya TaxID=4795 RepID=A0A225WT55_9STRA|nr:Cleavage induced protein [Phytophthora megakarya]
MSSQQLRQPEQHHTDRSVSLEKAGGMKRGRGYQSLLKSDKLCPNRKESDFPSTCASLDYHKSVSDSTCVPAHDRHKSIRPFTHGTHTPSTPITASSFTSTQQHRFNKTVHVRQRLVQWQLDVTTSTLDQALVQYGLTPPAPMPLEVSNEGNVAYLLDRKKQHVYSQLIRRAKLQSPAFVRLLRDESDQDPRPNKALAEPSGHPSWGIYRHRSRWREVIQHGIIPQWKTTFKTQVTAPSNHGSVMRAMNIIIKHRRAGQNLNRYLILEIDLMSALEDVTCSPFGAVQKGDVDIAIDARIIHDHSNPPGNSVNGNTAADHEIEMCYEGAEALENRILDVAQIFPTLQRMMTGDVNGAFRNIPMNADHVGRFAGTILELGILVMDLCCPFGWKNSPSSYWLAGEAISHLYISSAPRYPLQLKGGRGHLMPRHGVTTIRPSNPTSGPEY